MVGSTEIQSPYVSESTANDDHQVEDSEYLNVLTKDVCPWPAILR